MYIPSLFSETDIKVIQNDIRNWGFATLITFSNEKVETPHISHVPLLLIDDEDSPNGIIHGHLAKANPHSTALEGNSSSIAIFHGPHAYISPQWYGARYAVPTWNYLTVHAYGVTSIYDESHLVKKQLDLMVEQYESKITPQWSTSTLTDEEMSGLMKGIVCFKMPISSYQAKSKLGQNRKPDQIQGMYDGLIEEGSPNSLSLADIIKQRVIK